jgi:FAD/FMN-containing dehydrogenase
MRCQARGGGRVAFVAIALHCSRMARAIEHLAALRAIVGEQGLVAGAALASRDPGVDARNLAAGLLVRPATIEQVSQVLALCNARALAVVPQGGRTGLAGGAVTGPGELILSLERLDRIAPFDVAGRTVLAEAGVTLERLDAQALAHGLTLGVDLGARGSATIGGMISTNAGGMQTHRYGTMRERVLGLEAVLADGRVLSELLRVRKDNSGYPLRQLFIGSEGTLGVVTRAVLSLVPAGGARQGALLAVPGLGAAVEVLRALERAPQFALVAAELMSHNHLAVTARALGLARFVPQTPAPYALLIAGEGPAPEPVAEALAGALAELAGRGLIDDALLPKNEGETRDLWRIREDWAVDRERPGGLWFDISVPLDALERYVADLNARLRAHDPALGIVLVGHLADGNLHVTVNAEQPISTRYSEVAPLVYAGLAACGGSYSAEHGIGLEKRADLAALGGEVKLDLMRRIKAVFDPLGILNPGKVLVRE